MSAFLRKIIDTLFPRRCPACGKWTAIASPSLCPACTQKLTEEYLRPCPICKSTAALCTCQPPGLLGNSIPIIARGFYEPGKTDSVTSRLIYSLKHRTDDSAAHLLARDLSGAILREFLSSGEDIRTWTVTYAPRSAAGYEKDGFDQAQRLAKVCARYTGARYASLFCRRGGNIQKKLTEKERQINAAASLRLRHPRRRHTGKYILVDDILTTGATLAECANLLRLSGAESLRIAVPLRTIPRLPKAELWFAETK